MTDMDDVSSTPVSATMAIGQWTFDPSRCELSNATETRQLEPLAARLLEVLAERQGTVVSNEDLIQLVWDGRIVSDGPIYKLVAVLRRSLEDGTGNEYVRTVRKRGYVLDTPVQRLAPAPDSSAGANQRRSAALSVKAAVVLALVLAVVAALLLMPRDDETGPGESARVAIAVIPFDALSPDLPEYLSEGLTRELTNRLASIPELAVIAFQSSREFGNAAVPPAETGRLLNADVLIYGSIFVDEDEQARLTLNLVNPANGVTRSTHAESGAVGDLLGIESEIIASLVRELDANLSAVPRTDAILAALDEPEIYAAYITALRALDQGYARETMLSAIDSLSVVLDARPDFEPALAARATAHARLYYNYIDRSSERIDAARQDAQLARSIAPDSADALTASGYVNLVTGNVDAAIREFEQAVKRRPSSPDALNDLGQAYSRLFDMPAALEYLGLAARLDPRNARYLMNLGLTEMIAGRYEAAERSFDLALASEPTMAEAHLYRSLVYIIWQGDLDRFNRAYDQLQDLLTIREQMEFLLQPGLWPIVTYLEDTDLDTLASWSTEESGGDAASWHLAMAVRAQRYERPGKAYADVAAGLLLEAFEQEPDSPWIGADLALALSGAERHDEALETIDRVIELAPISEDPWTNSDFLWIRAHVLLAAGDVEAAAQQIDEASRHRTLASPASLKLDPVWQPFFDSPYYDRLVVDDGQRWRNAPE